jgi:hypothetical protein
MENRTEKLGKLSVILAIAAAVLLGAVLHASASDVGTATPELCKAKGMAFVKQSKNGRRAHCRAKAGKAGK